MAGWASRPGHGAVGLAPEVRPGARRSYLDNLKVLLIVAIIALHGVLGYAGSMTLWSYADVQEVTLATGTEVALLAVAGPFGLFMMGLLFLVAGLLAAPSLERKGPGRFARDRAIRLGVPFLAFTLLLWPALMYALYHPLGEAPGTYAEELLDTEGNLDTGPMWFIGVLLVFSLVYAAWTSARPPRAEGRAPRQLTARHLLALAVVVALSSFLVRLVWPMTSESFTDLNLWEWPACAGLFGLGVVASRHGWLDEVPPRLRRTSRDVTWAMVALAGAYMGASGALGVETEDLLGGWDWPPLLFVAIESGLNVFGSVWFLGLAQRRLAGCGRRRTVLGRNAYGAFLVQGFVLIGLAVALRPVDVPAEAKALLVAVGGVVGSFALAWLLTSRVRLLGRIL